MNCGAIYRKNPQPQRQVQSQPQQGQMPQQQVPQSQSSVYNNQQMSQNVNLQSQVQNQQVMQNNQQIPVQNQQSYNQPQMNMPNQQQYNNMQGNIQNQQYYNNQQVNMQGQPQVNMQNRQNMNVTAPSQQSYNNNQQIPRKKNNTGKIVGAVIGGIAILIIAVVGLTTVMKKAQSTKIDTEVSEIVNELPTNAIESEPSVAESSVATSEPVSGVEESSVASESTYEPSSSTSDNMYSYYYHGITFKMNYGWYSNLDLDDSDGSLFIMPEEYDGNFGIFIYYDQSMDGITYNTFDSDSTCLEYVTTIANTIELTNTQYKYQLGDNAHTFIITGYDDTNGYAYILDLITKDNHEYTFVAYGYHDFDVNTVNQAVQDFINNSDMISVLGL
jgi:hypothetical protein